MKFFERDEFGIPSPAHKNRSSRAREVVLQDTDFKMECRRLQ